MTFGDALLYYSGVCTGMGILLALQVVTAILIEEYK